jgi:CheY-like chemotaxis protein
MRSTSGRSVGKRMRKKLRRPAKRGPAPKPDETDNALAAFAHEIRTSLTGILALGELLAASGLGAREARWANAVKGTAEHLASLINLVIDSAKAGAAKLDVRQEPFRPRLLAEAVAASLAARSETKGVRHEIAIARDLPESVIGDAVRLRAALENLIDNAVKFTETGGIRFEVTGKPLARGRMRLAFAVTDSGIGLTAREIKRLFRPFAQANETIARHYGGAGLGLVFAKRVAKAMGGDLTVKSVPGRGSSFCLTTVVKAAPPEFMSRANAKPLRLKPARALAVLCVEDNPYGRVVLNTILTELGHRADFVGGSEAAVEALKRGSYDVVLMDVMLPEIDGFEATRRIRALPKSRAGIPVIGISGRAAADDEAKGRAAGMDGYLTKPVSPRLLAELLESLGSPRR